MGLNPLFADVNAITGQFNAAASTDAIAVLYRRADANQLLHRNEIDPDGYIPDAVFADFRNTHLTALILDTLDRDDERYRLTNTGRRILGAIWMLRIPVLALRASTHVHAAQKPHLASTNE